MLRGNILCLRFIGSVARLRTSSANMPDYVDILALLQEATSSLKHGELIQSSRLTLAESTSAIEIGEPRMDAGVSIAEERSQPIFDMGTALMPTEIVWIMDMIISYEVSKKTRVRRNRKLPQ